MRTDRSSRWTGTTYTRLPEQDFPEHESEGLGSGWEISDSLKAGGGAEGAGQDIPEGGLSEVQETALFLRCPGAGRAPPGNAAHAEETGTAHEAARDGWRN